MEIFVATFALFALTVLAMAIGTIFSNRQLQGSCGGIGSDDCSCSLADRAACPRKPTPDGA